MFLLHFCLIFLSGRCNCKFFTNSFMNNNIYGKCCLFPKTERNIDYFVTGIEKNIEYYYCSVARNNDDMCGKEGKKYINI